MTRIVRTGDAVEVTLTDVERELLAVLVQQYEQVVRDEGDPAADRLFPRAYREDADAAAEFRRYTHEGLSQHKVANAGAVSAMLVSLTADGADASLRLSSDDVDRWLPLLTDLRLVVAERLGIRTDDDPMPDGEMSEVYHWLGAVQAMLIDALEPGMPDGSGWSS